MTTEANGKSNGHGGAVKKSNEREPIAIIGIGCRFPGDANDPASFWKILRDGMDVLTEIPTDRWSLDLYYDPHPGKVGRTNVKYGGFIKGIDQFDAHFFGISPREAAFMDPQQRLLLEVAWEALEDGGQTIEKLAGTNTGVFVGIASFDYALIQSSSPDREAVDVYTNTGGALSIAANRISYCFNLKGPSAAVDTACSSSLFALHLACENLWNKTCPLALVGGVHVLISPGPYIGFSRLNMLSADGRCKAFDARANGFVRSEGAGVVVVKPLSAALADGDQVYAVIRAATINQDGRTSGLTVPSQQAQAQLVRDAYQQAGVEPSRVQFVEAHGTGTLVGDPIEARALGEILGQGRSPEQPCLVGSVKTNIGHLEAGAGMAGLVKTALALKHRLIPPNLHFEEPNPDIPLEDLRLRVPTKLEPWPASDGPAVAGVNSFGFGGTNAHVVLEEAPHQARASEPMTNGHSHEKNGNTYAPVCRPELVPLSARSEQALPAAARKLADWLEAEGATVPFGDICRSSALRRSHHEYRMGVVAQNREELVEQLRKFASGEADASVVTDRVVPHQEPRLVFVCSGQGPQWWAMGRELLAQEPVFRAMIERCDELMRPLGDWSLLEELRAEECRSRMHITAISQPAIFAIQVALAALWESWGVRPDAVVGHSVGEAAAAYIAGALSLEDAVRVIFHRGRCMECAPTRGRMLAVGLAREEAEKLARESEGRIFLAAVNSPSSMTLSGEPDALEELAQQLQERQVFQRFLQVNYAFHSSQMDPVREPLLEALQGIRPVPTRIPLWSTVTGQLIEGPELTGDYWWRNVRQSVLFSDAVEHLIEEGYDAAVELSAHPVLGSAVAECYRQRGKKIKVLASLRRKEPERPAMLRALAGLHTAGRSLDWSAVVPAGKTWAQLPTYPWQHETFWHETDASREQRLGKKGHPLLGGLCRTPEPTWESKVGTRLQPYLADHRVQGAALMPGTGYLEMMLAAGKHVHTSGPYLLEEVKLLKACFLSEGVIRTVRTTYQPEDAAVVISSQTETGEKNWTTHVRAYLRQWQDKAPETPIPLAQIKARCPRDVAGPVFYALLHKVGIDYGPHFQGVVQLWQGNGEALAQIRAPEALTDQQEVYYCHPAVLDACLQATMGVLPERRDMQGAIVLPVEIDLVRIYGRLGQELWSHARLVEINRQGLVVDLRICNELGQLVVEIRGLQCQILGAGASASAEGALDELLYEYQWQFKPRASQEKARRALDYVPGLEPIREHVVGLAQQLIKDKGLLSRYAGLEPALNHLCAVYVLNALRELGGQFSPGQRFSAGQLLLQLGIIGQHHRLMDRYLAMFQEEGILRQDGAEWEVVREPAYEDPEPLWQDLLSRNPAFFAELTLIRRCARQLHEVLRGETNPLQLIFPEGSLATAEHLYQDSPSVRFYNTLAQQAIHQVLAKLPPGKTVRVLEIGAGTGGLTSYVLPWLPAGRTEYTFTDLSNHFFIKGEQKFADYPFIKYQKLDIEKSPLDQGFTEHSFDLVLASQVLHATTDLRQTLNGVREVLASEGLLVLLEVVKPARWVDLVFGLTDGWWKFSDTDLRQEYPLLSFPRWQGLLGEMGFTETVDVAGNNAEGGLGSAVILSRGPALAPVATPAQAPARKEAAGTWLLFADRGGTAERLAGLLRSRGGRCVLAFAGEDYQRLAEDQFTVAPGSVAGMQQLLEDVLGTAAARKAGAAAPNCRGVLHLWNLDAADPLSVSGDQAAGLQVTGALSVVNLVQAWNESAGDLASLLWLVTRQAQTVDPRTEHSSLMQTPAWGLGRVLINEFPRLRCRLVDLGDASPEELNSLLEEIAAPDEEDEIALRGEARYVHRFVRTALEKQGMAAADQGFDSSVREGSNLTERETINQKSSAAAFRLEVSQTGVLDGLALRPAQRQQPGPGLVEIQVVAAALNFSDVMKALGLYPGLPDGPVPLGIECAGRISAVGPDVTDFRVGDEVLAIAPSSFGSHTISHTGLVAHKPKHITFEEAATLPIAFLTAAYALEYMGHLQEGERVLIHAATGGVGLAAIQLAQRAGAEVFATAGSTEKRQFLQALGVKHIMNSRSLAFADEVMELTDGRGVDLVLNSLSGEAIPKGLSTLADYGRFLEIGKRDIYGNSRIGLKPFRKNLSFIAIDLDRAMRERPRVLAGLFQKVVKEIEEGKLWPLPHRVFSISNVVSAFRYMSQAKHLGKVVVSLEERAKIAPEKQPPIRFKADATYLMTGGLGGFGLAVAQWMVEQGARHLVLMGRRGIHSPEVAKQVEELRQAGAEVVVARGDVSRAEDVASVLTDIARTMPPLKGVLHAAMVLEDCLLLKLNEERWMPIMEPKMNGVWNLHQQTLNLNLDIFLMFSSMTSMFGLPGQANYASSNTFLDALAGYRRSLGLPALTISWGYVAQVGYVARNEKTAERLEGQGVKGILPRQALALLGGLLQQRAVHVGVANIDWSSMVLLGPSAGAAPRFSSMKKEATAGKEGTKQDGSSIRKAVLGAPPEKRLEMMVNFLREKVARVLGANVSKVVVDKPLTELGLDSLMGVELRNWIEGELRVNLPIVELMQGPTITRVAELLLAQMTSDESGTRIASAPASEDAAALAAISSIQQTVQGSLPGPVPGNDAEETVDSQQAEELLGKLDELNDAEVDTLLGTMLSEKEYQK
jgi:acyl transferase domain-containing protein/aryl carrier-like protein